MSKKAGEKLKILFVDDETAILESFRRTMRPMRKKWDCEFADSGQEALRILSGNSFDLVVTDMRMPGMDGAQLLHKVKMLYPETIRFILSGQSEEKAFLRSVGCMHQFLSKPCDFDALKAAIDRALSLRVYLQNEKIKKVLLQVDSLPSLPELYCELMEELRSEDSTLENIGKTISKDLGMTAKILQVANSAFFGIPQRVSTPVHAVQILGLDLIQTLVLTYQIFAQMDISKSDEIIVERIWEHSVNVAGKSMLLAKAKKMGSDIESYSYTAGLLHDIGVVLVLLEFPEIYRELLQRPQESQKENLKTELEIILGNNHARIGAYLMGIWGLPDPVVEAIAYHEDPSACVSRLPSPLTFVHVANALEEEFCNDPICLEGPTKIDEAYLKEVGVCHRLPFWEKICSDYNK